ncbi:hypothetical protein LBMAG42_04900 [Deltaproteobacteria bacterium]|nr:hypothetical protein LBMAG42_04900 [Deltaproteobacteria bacterium]
MLTVVGAGRIGGALHDLATKQGLDVLLVKRGEEIPDVAGPVVVCTRNDDVAAVVAASPRPQDLCFVQNGALLPWLREVGLGGNTQGLLYFAVSAAGAAPEPGGESVFFGRHAPTLVYLLSRAGLPARALASEAELLDEITVKLLWASIFGLMGDLHRETVLASAARREEVAALVRELNPVCLAGIGSRIGEEEVTRRLLAYSMSIGSWRASVKEWRWRNGWLAKEAARLGLAVPLHGAVCSRIGVGA